MIEQLFEVATEFRFDVGQALLNTGALQQAVDGLSQSANAAMSNLSYMAGGLVAHLGFGSGGLLSVLTRAVQVSQSFQMETLNFANNISSNFSLLSGHINTFNDRLETSEVLMDNVRKTATEVGLPASDLASITQLVSSPLAARNKLGTNYAGGISMAKNMMIASESVGLPARVGAESIAQALSGGMIHGKIWERLVNTDAMRAAGVHNQMQFSPRSMEQDKRIDLLTKALEQLGGNAEFITYRLNTLSGQFQVFKNQIEDLIKPIGDAIITPLKQLFKAANEYLRNHGKEIGESIGRLISDLLRNPEALILDFMQLSKFKFDFRKALNIASWAFLSATLMKMIPITKGLGTALEAFLGVSKGLGIIQILTGSFSIFRKIILVAHMALAEFIPVVASLLFFFQAISRARAMAKVDDAKDLAEMFPKFTTQSVKLRQAIANIILPITMAIDGVARLLEPLFKMSFWYGVLLDVMTTFTTLLDYLGTAVVYVTGAVAGLVSVFMGFFLDIAKFHNPFKNIVSNFKGGFDDFLKDHPFGNRETPVSKATVNNYNKIDARFDMREQMEPDRIAFAVTSHLKRLAINPSQGNKQSIYSGMANPKFAGAT